MKITCSVFVIAFMVAAAPALASPGGGGNGNGGNSANAPGHIKHEQGSDPKGTPGPIAGAGLPFLAIGYGAYWLIKRRRKVQG